MVPMDSKTCGGRWFILLLSKYINISDHNIYIFFLPNIFRDQMGFPEVCFPWFFQPPPQDPQALMAKVEREDWTMKGWTYW